MISCFACTYFVRHEKWDKKYEKVFAKKKMFSRVEKMYVFHVIVDSDQRSVNIMKIRHCF